jgi:hypothetical protein
MRIYIAGPMTGLPAHNLPAFAAAAKQLAALGYDAVNPGRRGVVLGYTWRDYMRDALRELLGCEAVALLDGWEHSRGAALEVHVAQALGMPVQPLTHWTESTA